MSFRIVDSRNTSAPYFDENNEPTTDENASDFDTKQEALQVTKFLKGRISIIEVDMEPHDELWAKRLYERVGLGGIK
jgi:hypothetical protein